MRSKYAGFAQKCVTDALPNVANIKLSIVRNALKCAVNVPMNVEKCNFRISAKTMITTFFAEKAPVL